MSAHDSRTLLLWRGSCFYVTEVCLSPPPKQNGEFLIVNFTEISLAQEGAAMLLLETTFQQKLYCDVEDLRCTTSFMADTGVVM